MTIDPKGLGNARYAVGDMDTAPPFPGMSPELWRAMTSMAAATALTSLAQLAAGFAEREQEADTLAERHAEHGCPMAAIAHGIGLGVAGCLAVIRDAMQHISAKIPEDMARTAIQAAETVAQAAPHFHADPDRLEAAIREGLAEAMRAHEEATAKRAPIRPRSPRDGGAIH